MKAALEAWGNDANLFAQGIAEQVTDEKLMKAPLARPGEVIKVLRGSTAEHVMKGSPCPVVVAPHGYEATGAGIRTIGAAFVPTEGGRAAR